MMKSHMYLFPFSKVEKGSRIILVGASLVTEDYIQQIRSMDYCDILFVVDRDPQKQNEVLGLHVKSLDLLATEDFDYAVVSLGDSRVERVKPEIVRHAGDNHEKIVWPIKGNKIPLVITQEKKKNGFLSKLFGSANNKIKDSVDPKIFAFYEKYKHQQVFSFAKNGEDIVISHIFDILGVVKPSYIDIGAHHPFKSSNTALFYDRGSRGILIEANPNYTSQLKNARPHDIVLNVGVGDTPGNLDFYMVGDYHGVNSFSKEHVERFIAKYPELELQEVRKIPVTTLGDVINEQCGGVWPHFLDIDVEGLEYGILSGCSFDEQNPMILCVECYDKNTAMMNDMLADKGYEPFCRIASNNIYLKKGLSKMYFDKGQQMKTHLFQARITCK